MKNAGIKEDTTIFMHHHFRNGDKVTNAAFDVAATPAQPKLGDEIVAAMRERRRIQNAEFRIAN